MGFLSSKSESKTDVRNYNTDNRRINEGDFNENSGEIQFLDGGAIGESFKFAQAALTTIENSQRENNTAIGNTLAGLGELSANVSSAGQSEVLKYFALAAAAVAVAMVIKG